eukprot:scaffold281756_cov30-Tisochrysis_lutea.AAC.2
MQRLPPCATAGGYSKRSWPRGRSTPRRTPRLGHAAWVPPRRAPDPPHAYHLFRSFRPAMVPAAWLHVSEPH